MSETQEAQVVAVGGGQTRGITMPGPRAPRKERTAEAAAVTDGRWKFVEDVCKATGEHTIARGIQVEHFAAKVGWKTSFVSGILYSVRARGVTQQNIDEARTRLADVPGLDALNWEVWLASAFPEGSTPARPARKPRKPRESNPDTKKAPPSGGTAGTGRKGSRSSALPPDDERSITDRFPVPRERRFLVSESTRSIVLDISTLLVGEGREFVVVIPVGASYEEFQALDGRTYLVIAREQDEPLDDE